MKENFKHGSLLLALALLIHSQDPYYVLGREFNEKLYHEGLCNYTDRFDQCLLYETSSIALFGAAFIIAGLAQFTVKLIQIIKERYS